SEKSNNIENNTLYDDNNCSDVDEFMVNLNQISKNLIDDIHVFNTNCDETIPKLIDIFDSKI
ncbi:7781_t:CDS:1, partial [Racocetra fulgida]